MRLRDFIEKANEINISDNGIQKTFLRVKGGLPSTFSEYGTEAIYNCNGLTQILRSYKDKEFAKIEIIF